VPGSSAPKTTRFCSNKVGRVLRVPHNAVTQSKGLSRSCRCFLEALRDDKAQSRDHYTPSQHSQSTWTLVQCAEVTMLMAIYVSHQYPSTKRTEGAKVPRSGPVITNQNKAAGF
jgi:hypothetical protein